jgi:hypothetical protein
VQEALVFFNKYQVKDAFIRIIRGNAVWGLDKQEDSWQKLIILDQQCEPWKMHESVSDWMLKSSDLGDYVDQLKESTRSRLLVRSAKKRKL